MATFTNGLTASTIGNTLNMGYYETEGEVLPYIARMLNRSAKRSVIIDISAGEGRAVKFLSEAWNAVPYAVELDERRAAACREILPFNNVVNGSAFTFRTSEAHYPLIFNNAPYVAYAKSDAERTEQKFLPANNKLLSKDGGIMVIMVYAQHLADPKFANYIVTQFTEHRIFRIPVKHLGNYMQLVIFARTNGKRREHLGTGKDIVARAQYNYERNKEIASLSDLEGDSAIFESIVDAEPLDWEIRSAELPDVFRGAEYDAAKIEHDWMDNMPIGGLGFRDAAIREIKPRQATTLLKPRPAHLAVMIQSQGLLNGCPIFDNTTQKWCLIRSRTIMVERTVESEEEIDNGTKHTRSTYKANEPVTSILYEDGVSVPMDGDGLVEFVANNLEAVTAIIRDRVQVIYQLDYMKNQALKRVIHKMRLNKAGGHHKLATTQRHVLAAMYAILCRQKGGLLAAEPGFGKTFLAASMIALMQYREANSRDFSVNQLMGKYKKHYGMVDLVIVPPHLASRTIDEIKAVMPEAIVMGVYAEDTNDLNFVEQFRLFQDARKESMAKNEIRPYVLVLSRSAKAGEGWVSSFQFVRDRHDIRREVRQKENAAPVWYARNPETNRFAEYLDEEGIPTAYRRAELASKRLQFGLEAGKQAPRGIKHKLPTYKHIKDAEASAIDIQLRQMKRLAENGELDEMSLAYAEQLAIDNGYEWKKIKPADAVDEEYTRENADPYMTARMQIARLRRDDQPKRYEHMWQEIRRYSTLESSTKISIDEMMEKLLHSEVERLSTVTLNLTRTSTGRIMTSKCRMKLWQERLPFTGTYSDYADINPPFRHLYKSDGKKEQVSRIYRRLPLPDILLKNEGKFWLMLAEKQTNSRDVKEINRRTNSIIESLESASKKPLENEQKAIIWEEVVIEYMKQKWVADKPWRNPKNPKGTLNGVADIIIRELGNDIHLLIVDEAHEDQKGEESAQGAFTLRLAQKATSVMFMTATPFNGYSSSMRAMMGEMIPKFNEKYPRSDEGLARYMRDFGRMVTHEVTKRVIGDAATSGVRVTKTRETQEAIGASSRMVVELLGSTVWVGLRDMRNDMPPNVSSIEETTLNGELYEVFHKAHGIYSGYTAGLRTAGKNSGYLAARGVLTSFGLSYPNTPFTPYYFTHAIKQYDPLTGDMMSFDYKHEHITPAVKLNFTQKESDLLEKIRAERELGNRVTVFTNSPALTKRLHEVVESAGYQTSALYQSTVDTHAREQWFKQQIADGMEVLVTNFQLVKTGIDLVETTTLMFYAVSTDIRAIIQAAGRAWRKIQTNPCSVRYLIWVEESKKEVEGKIVVTKTLTAEGAVLWLNTIEKQKALNYLSGDSATGTIDITAGKVSIDQQIANLLEKGLTLDELRNADAQSEAYSSMWEIVEDEYVDEDEILFIEPTTSPATFEEFGMFEEEPEILIPAPRIFEAKPVTTKKGEVIAVQFSMF